MGLCIMAVGLCIINSRSRTNWIYTEWYWIWRKSSQNVRSKTINKNLRSKPGGNWKLAACGAGAAGEKTGEQQ